MPCPPQQPDPRPVASPPEAWPALTVAWRFMPPAGAATGPADG